MMIIILLFQDIINKSEQALKELRSYQRSVDMNCSSLQVLADYLLSLTEDFKEKLEERMKQYKKQNAFLEVLQKVKMRVLNFKYRFTFYPFFSPLTFLPGSNMVQKIETVLAIKTRTQFPLE